MNNYIIYLGKVSILQALFYAFYSLIFKKNTSFALQRFYLLCSMTLPFVIPLITLQSGWNVIHVPVKPVFSIDYNEIPFSGSQSGSLSENYTVIFSGLVLLLYFSGFFLLLYNFLRSAVKLARYAKYDTSYRRDRLKIVTTSEITHPFSFFNRVLFNPSAYTFREIHHILVHEQLHARQFHTVDLILAGIIHIVCWFNPVIILYKRSLTEVHEFLADENVLRSGINPVEYQQLILKHACSNHIVNFTSSFNVSLTKKRIIMMTIHKKTGTVNLKFLLVVPLVFLCILIFSGSTIGLPVEKGERSVSTLQENKPDMSPIDVKDVTMTSGYGIRKHPITGEEQFHQGIDLAAPLGTPVKATANGNVIRIEDEHFDPDKYGKYIVIQHDEVYSTMYTQLSEVLVKEGQAVKKGEMIGKVGESGRSTGPHLHYEVWKNGEKVDPVAYMQ